ncbi:MAG: hypothetical protein ACTH1Z_07955 [Ancrocorticia sp.]|uniref:hypothetical protein n=1 Tax=Ancrocorticia sp. TaxID=2593684 RepID=UPI003F8E5F44
MVLVQADQFSPDQAQVTTWDISGQEPKQLWTGEWTYFADNYNTMNNGILGNNFVSVSALNDITSGKAVTTPWSTDPQDRAAVTVFGSDLAVACTVTAKTFDCAGYDGELQELWTQEVDFPSSEQLAMPVSVVSENAVKTLYCTRQNCQILDNVTGELTTADHHPGHALGC